MQVGGVEITCCLLRLNGILLRWDRGYQGSIHNDRLFIEIFEVVLEIDQWIIIVTQRQLKLLLVITFHFLLTFIPEIR